MKEFLKNVDFFSRDINLTKENSIKFSTSIGIVSSIVIILLTTLLMIYYLDKIFNCDLQSNIIYTKTDSIPQEFIFKDYFPYIVRLEDDDSNSLNSSIVNIVANYFYSVKNDKGNWETSSYVLNLTYCNISKFPEKYYNLIKAYSLETALCVDFDNNPELKGIIRIQGSWFDTPENHIMYASLLCNGEGFNCLKNTSLKEQMIDKKTYFSIYSLDEIYHPHNYSFPGSSYLNYQSFVLSKDLTKFYTSFLTRTNIMSDSGLFIENFEETDLTQNKVSFNEYILFEQDNLHSFFYIDVCGNKDVVFASRQYMKIQNAISLVIPIFNSLIMFVKIIINPFVDLQYSESIVNDLISLDFPENEKLLHHKINQNIEQLVKDDNLTKKISNDTDIYDSKNQFTNKISKGGNTNHNEKKRKKKIKSEVNLLSKKTVVYENKLTRKLTLSEKIISQKLFFSLFDFVKYYLLCMRKEKIQMKLDLKNKIEETLFHFTDLITLIKSFQEIEIMKSISMDDKKKKIFQSTFNNAFNNRIGYSLVQKLLNIEQNAPNLNKNNEYNQNII